MLVFHEVTLESFHVACDQAKTSSGAQLICHIIPEVDIPDYCAMKKASQILPVPGMTSVKQEPTPDDGEGQMVVAEQVDPPQPEPEDPEKEALQVAGASETPGQQAAAAMAPAAPAESAEATIQDVTTIPMEIEHAKEVEPNGNDPDSEMQPVETIEEKNEPDTQQDTVPMLVDPPPKEGEVSALAETGDKRKVSQLNTLAKDMPDGKSEKEKEKRDKKSEKEKDKKDKKDKKEEKDSKRKSKKEEKEKDESDNGKKQRTMNQFLVGPKNQ